MGRRDVVRQSDFSFGELSESYAASDVAAKTKSLKRGTNVRILNSYGFSQRHGSRRMATTNGGVIDLELITSAGVSYIGVVRIGGVDIYSQDGALLQSVSGAPWATDAEVAALTWHTRQDEAYFTHQSYWPRVMTYAAGVWSLGLVNPDAGAGSSSQQPYFRFAGTGITLTPSALTGAITVAFSAAVLSALHAGVRFRYGATLASAKEIRIDTVVDAQNATATVLDALPPTFTVTVVDASGYRVGEDVEGLDSSATGVVTGIAGNDLTVLMSDNFNSFLTGASSEYVVGPFHRSKATAVAAASPAASTVWDEAALSPARGYPGDVFERSGRLGFADFPQIPGGILLSAPGARRVFSVGKGEAQDAIFFLLADGGQRVKFCVSASNLIILTDRRTYYVPENESAPLAANTFEPIEISPTGTSSAFPVVGEEGVIYVERGGNRIMGLFNTGQINAPFRAVDLSRHANHLIKNPVSLAMTTGNEQSPERYIFALNEDGTLTCMFFDITGDSPRLGLTPWNTSGLYLAMVPILGIIYGLCRRTIAGNSVVLLERLDAAVQMDASSLFSDSGSYLALTDDDGNPITDDAGDPILTDIPAMLHLANATVKVIRGTEYLGEFMVGTDGAIPGIEAADGDFEAGLHFDVDAVLWPPESQYDQRTMFARRRIAHVATRVLNSCVYTVGLLGRAAKILRPAYDQGEDTSAAPPIRSEVKRYPLAGYEHEPCIQYGRPLPQPLTVLGVAQEVIVT